MAQKKAHRKNAAAVKLAKKRWAKVTPEERREIARRTALARWRKKK